MPTKWITSPDGKQIAFDITGQGPTLMLLHGAGKTRQEWHTFGYVDRLKDHFTVIAVDIRGTGESDYLVDEDDYAIEKICQDLYAVASACNVEQFAIWGFSFGGKIAGYLAARFPFAHPERITAIALIGVPFGLAVDEAFDAYIRGLEEKYGYLAEAQKGGSDRGKKRSPIKGQMAGWLACFHAMRAWPRVDPGDVRCPALLVVGTKNKNCMGWVDTHREELVQAGIELQIVDDLTHNQEFTEVDQLFPILSQFFKAKIF